MATFKHVIWDWNGTLLDDAWLCVEIINKLLHRRGMPAITPAHYQRIFGIPLEDYCRRLGLDESEFETISAEFVQLYERRRFDCQLQPHAVELFDALRAAGVAQSILSAYQQHFLEEIVAHFELDLFFAGVLGLDNPYGRGKIERGQEWIAGSGLDPAEVLLVGDMTHDSQVAAAMGVNCVLVTSGHQIREKLEGCSARVVDDLAGLRHLLGIDA